jgi:ABC-type Fe3+-citrate transport system substrate-binding protein
MKLFLPYFKSFLLIFFLYYLANSFAKIEKQNRVKVQIDALKLKDPPKRVVSLSVSAIEALDVLGIKPVGISVTASGKIPEYLMDKMKDVQIVGTIENPSLERIQDLKPDLILVDRVYEEQRDVINKLNKIAPVINFRAENYKETLEYLQIFGDLFNKRKEASDFIKNFNTIVKNVKESGKKHPTSILAIYITNNVIWAWTDKSFLASILGEINVDYSYKGPGNKDYPDLIQLNGEKILEIDPEQLLIFEDPGKEVVAFLEKSAVWKNLKAVKNKKLHIVNRDIWSRSRGPIAAEIIIKNMGNVIK